MKVICLVKITISHLKSKESEALDLECTVSVEEHCKDHTICHTTGASRAFLEQLTVASIFRNPAGLRQYYAGKGSFSSAAKELVGQSEDGKLLEYVVMVNYLIETDILMGELRKGTVILKEGGIRNPSLS